jgi:hypothetical protein
MSAKNIYHDAVVEALIADGWTITHDPLTVMFGGRKLYVDMAADRQATVGAERGGERIAVEVQSFISPSKIADLQQAVGQYVIYRILLDELKADRLLYLAVPQAVYDTILSEQLGQLMVARLHMRLLVFDPDQRRVAHWIS